MRLSELLLLRNDSGSAFLQSLVALFTTPTYLQRAAHGAHGVNGASPAGMHAFGAGEAARPHLAPARRIAVAGAAAVPLSRARSGLAPVPLWERSTCSGLAPISLAAPLCLILPARGGRRASRCGPAGTASIMLPRRRPIFIVVVHRVLFVALARPDFVFIVAHIFPPPEPVPLARPNLFYQ